MSNLVPKLLTAAAASLAALGVVLLGSAAGDHSRAVASARAGDPPRSVARLVEQLVREMPGRRSDRYEPPTARERRAIADAFELVRAGRLRAAARRARVAGYEVEELRGGYVALRERRRERPRGWGLFVHAPGARGPAIEVPHPRADVGTEGLGLELLHALDGSSLLVAGAHRAAGEDGSADVAHRDDSAFEAVHRVVLAERVPILQLHGFAPRDGDPDDAIVSPGAAPPGTVTAEVLAGLRAAGFDACAPAAGTCDRLEGRTNVQGRSAADAGVPFVHLELSRRVRDERSARRRLARALASLVAAPPGARA